MVCDEDACYVDQFDIGLLRSSRKCCERLEAGEVVAVHEDAFGLADDIAAGESSGELLFCGGAGQGDGGVLGEDFAGGDRLVGESARRGAVQG